MCSPAGHSIAALAIGLFRSRHAVSWKFVVLCVFSGNAADLDILLGWLLGDINKFHRLGSHSIAASLIYGLLVYCVLQILSSSAKITDWSNRPNRIKWAVSGALMYFSHCLLDMVSLDDAHPVGMQLLWPISEQFYTAPFTVFRSFLHHTVGSDMSGMVVAMLSWHNLVTVIHETAIMLPVLLFGLRNRNRRNSSK
jgi:membrane-bound metal-dependent hydrolase YbcI (DUF457 family)